MNIEQMYMVKGKYEWVLDRVMMKCKNVYLAWQRGIVRLLGVPGSLFIVK